MLLASPQITDDTRRFILKHFDIDSNGQVTVDDLVTCLDIMYRQRKTIANERKSRTM